MPRAPYATAAVLAVGLAVLAMLAEPAAAQEKASKPAALPMAVSAKDFVPRPGEFPAASTGVYLPGELVAVDPINRRGSLRLSSEGSEDRYHSAKPHAFALLPYGTVHYHGAPAELRDVPLGTYLHGRFYLAPVGDDTIPVDKRDRHADPHTHALSLEDNVSFCVRRGWAWKIESVDAAKGTLSVSLFPVAGSKHVEKEMPNTDGLPTKATLDINAATRVWKGRGQVELKDLAAGQQVQINLTWAPDWQNGRLTACDVWLDQESLDLAAGNQRNAHRVYERIRGLPGWVDHVDHQPGGKGVVTVTLFAGRDAELSAEFSKRMGQGCRIAAAEPTLRTWWHNHDYANAQISDVTIQDAPPPGSSGIVLKLRCDKILDGFRPGRIVRLSRDSWPRIKLPPEERIKSLDDR